MISLGRSLMNGLSLCIELMACIAFAAQKLEFIEKGFQALSLRGLHIMTLESES